ncbi:hypothetical protein RD792_016129 [Penstemon davidsonii]|uniref:MADS-box domain-containing protein n=1 Tax=Penstemon davidsonii TaxID=160366 RepID=A0ABR0CIH9_9LAMI|nr:hypothetical protein RD792_016129 [Penstemon davidsonii]
MAKKPSMGRQKIKIVKIEKKNHLQVTFSKRRSGLFKKASELSTLCGIEIAIIVFSPAGKVFSFGHPNVESVIDRFLARNPAAAQISNPFHLTMAQRNASVGELNLQLGQILNELEMERKRGETLDNMRKTNQGQYWWEEPVNKLQLNELEQLKEAMEELKKNVTNQATKLITEVTGNNNEGIGLGFGSGGGGVFEQYESKPGRGFMGSVVPFNNGYGYCHGFF